MSIRKKLLLGLLPGLVVILALGVIVLGALRVVVEQTGVLERLFHEHDVTKDLQLALQQATVPPVAYLLTGDTAERDRFAELAADVESRLDSLEKLGRDNREAAALVVSTREKWARVRALATSILDLPDPMGNPEGYRLMRQMLALTTELVTDFTQMHQRQLVDVIVAEQRARTVQWQTGVALTAVLAVILVGGVVFALLFSKALTRPLVALTDTAEALSRGDLKARASVRGSDEVARLGRTFNAMAAVLQRRLQRRAAEAGALNAIATAAVTAPDLETVLNTALDHLLPVLNVEAGAIFLPDENDAHALRLVAQRGLSATRLEAMNRLGAEGGLINQVYRRAAPLVLEGDGGQARPSPFSAAQGEEWESLVAVPLRFRSRVLGVLCLSASQKRTFSPEDRAFLMAAGDQMGNAVENACLRRETARRLQEVETLATLAELLNQTLETEEILEPALEVLSRSLGLAACWFVSYDPEPSDDRKPSGSFTLKVSHNLPAALQVTYREGGSCWCEVQALRGALTEATNVPRCDRLTGRSSQNTADLDRHATVPVRSGNRLLGLINLALPQGRPLDAHQLRLLTTAAGTLGVALERARLYEEVKARRIEEQAALLRLSQSLVGLLDVDAILDRAAATAQEVFAADLVSLMLPDASGKRLVLRAGRGWAPEHYGTFAVDIASSRAGYVFCRDAPAEVRGWQTPRTRPVPRSCASRGSASAS